MTVFETWMLVLWLAPGVVGFLVCAVGAMSGASWASEENNWWLFIWPLFAAFFVLLGIAHLIQTGIDSRKKPS